MSHATDAAIGMMDGAYFTSRNEILSFFNTLLNLNLTKIEQTASGAVACQLTEYIFPNSIPMSRVNWGAKSSFEYVDNYKLLQKAFTKHKIQRYVDVDKLIRGKYQDNLEFCQWLKAFFDQTAPMMSGREGYDPVAVRAKGKGGKSVPTGKGGGGMVKRSVAASSSSSARSSAARPTGASSRSATARSTSATTGNSSRPTSSSSAASSSRVSSSKENNRLPKTSSTTQQQPRGSKPPTSSTMSSAKAAKYEEQIRTLKSENTTLKSKYNELERSATELEMSLGTVESERDFYFEKLRGIEVMLQVYKEKEEEVEGSGDVNKVMESMFKVMYATMEDNVEVDDEGNLLGDITLESSIDKSALLNNSSIDKSALPSNKAQDELGNNDEQPSEDFLTPVNTENAVTDTLANEEEDGGVVEQEEEQPQLPMENQFASDESDDSLLIDDAEPVAKVDDTVNKIDDTEFKECLSSSLADDFSDEELLTED